MVNNLKYYLVFLNFFLIATFLQAQAIQEKKKISLGFEFGYQSTSITRDINSTIETESGSGLNAYTFASYPITNSINFELGLRYDNRAFKTKSFINPIAELQSDDSVYVSWSSYYKDNFKYRLNYLSIPISVIYNRGNYKHNILLKLSFYYSLLLNAHKSGTTELYIDPNHAENFEDPKLKQPGYTITDISNENASGSFNTDDYGIQLFVAYQYRINDKLALRFTPGLTIGFQQLASNPLDNSKWNNIYLINCGIIYTIIK